VLVEGAWGGAGGRVAEDYAPIRAALPLYGGSPSARLAALAVEAGFARTEVEPLTESVLWGGRPGAERYALHAWTSSAQTGRAGDGRRARAVDSGRGKDGR
jgi:hypothetical protein